MTGTREKAHTLITRHVCARPLKYETQIRTRQMKSFLRGEGSGGCKPEGEGERERQREGGREGGKESRVRKLDSGLWALGEVFEG